MKRYFLFVFGNLEDNTKLKSIIQTVSNICCSSFCKFKKNNNSISLNFAYNGNFDDLSEYIKDKIEKLSDYYILIEQNVNMSVNLPEEEMAEFLSLDSTEESNIDDFISELLIDEITMNGIDLLKEYISSENQMENIDEIDDYTLYDNKKVNPLNLDNILDKINEKGINSLTIKEKEYLNSFKK